MNALFKQLQSIFDKKESDEGASASFLQGLAQYLALKYKNKKCVTGEPCLEYSLDIARRLKSLYWDKQTCLAGMLWNVYRFEKDAETEITKLFGREIAELARSVNKISEIDYKKGENVQAEKFRHLILALAKDVRAVFIRMIDRAHVLSRIDQYPSRNPEKDALEVRELYAPLANRLGIGKLKSELEDLSLSIIKPDIYEELKRNVAARQNAHEKYLDEIKRIISENLREAGIKAEVKGRVKHIDSIYRKMLKQKIPFDEVYDVVGIRIITESEKECYSILGIIHSLWRPIPKRFKDYIAVPKQNMYRSIHTSVIGPHASPLEVQIRTKEMDRIAEIGIAAHWRYKEGVVDKRSEEKFAWLRQLMEWINESKSAGDVLEMFKVDLFPEEVYVFTPKGDVKSLPKNASVIDFAFAIHSEIGFHCKGARINNRLVPLKTKLSNGDIVEIITGSDCHPRIDWLKYVVTTSAKSAIRKYLRVAGREKSIADGKHLIKKQLRKFKIPLEGVFETKEMTEVAQKLGFKSVDDMLAAVGFGELTAHQIINRFVVLKSNQPMARIPSRKKRTRTDKSGVIISKYKNIEVHMARCCEPIPGEDIVGFITHGRGITIHATRCGNLKKLQKERIIKADWEPDDKPSYPVRIVFQAYKTPEILHQLINVMTDNNIQIITQKITTTSKRKNTIKGEFQIELTDMKQLKKLIREIKDIPGMISVDRLLSR